MRQLSADGRRPCPQGPETRARALTHQAAVVTVLLSRWAILKLGNGKCKCKCPCAVLVTTCGAQRTVVVWRVWDYLLYVCEFEMK